jgi:hypothetical protein
MRMKKVLFVVVLSFLVTSTNANAASVTVNYFICNNLSIAYPSTLTLDSADSYGIIRSTPFFEIETYIKNGYAGGAWNGLGGINSSVAAADSNRTTSLALIGGQDYLDYCDSTGSLQFFGNPVQSSNSLIRYAYYGDANLDGVVDDMDYNNIEIAINSGGPAAGFSGWVWGDFNYDGLINDADLALFNRNYLSNSPSLGSAQSTPAIAWKGGSSTNWAAVANWDPNTTVPNGAGTKVRFGDQDSTTVVDMVSHGQRVGSITFAASTNTTIKSSGGYSLTLDNNGQSSTIDVAGNQTISAPVLLDNDAIIFGPGTLHLTGGITGNHTLTVLGNLTATRILVDTLNIGNSGTSQAVPEPSTIALLLTATLGGLLLWHRRR